MDEDDRRARLVALGGGLDDLQVAARQLEDLAAIGRRLGGLGLVVGRDRVERQRDGDHDEQGDDYPDRALHLPSPTCSGVRPSSSARSAIASMTNWMCSFSSTPSSSIPRWIPSRSTAAANDGCLSFLRTDLVFMPSIPVGRTSAQAAMKPESSST